MEYITSDTSSISLIKLATDIKNIHSQIYKRFETQGDKTLVEWIVELKSSDMVYYKYMGNTLLFCFIINRNKELVIALNPKYTSLHKSSLIEWLNRYIPRYFWCRISNKDSILLRIISKGKNKYRTEVKEKFTFVYFNEELKYGD